MFKDYVNKFNEKNDILFMLIVLLYYSTSF